MNCYLLLDLKDAFHSLRLTEKLQNIIVELSLTFDSASYLYQRMPMGLNISPCNLAILYKCDFGLFAKQETLQSNYG